MTGAFLVGTSASIKEGLIRSALFDLSATICPIEELTVDDSDAPCSIGRWLWVEPADRQRLGPTRRALRYNRRTKDDGMSAEAAKLVEDAGCWWRDLVRAVHRAAGAPTCFLYHWYEGQFATEIVRPKSWQLIAPATLTSTTFLDLDFDEALVMR